MSNKCNETLYRNFPKHKYKKRKCPNPSCGKKLSIDARRCDRCGICIEC